MDQFNFKESTRKNILEFLNEDCNFHEAYESLDPEQEGFISEMVLDHRRYFTRYLLDEKSEFLIVHVYPGLEIPKANILKACAYCASRNCLKKTTYLNVDINLSGAVYAHAELSFQDAPISTQTIQRMVFMLTMDLRICLSALKKIADGEAPEEDDDNPDKFFAHLCDDLQNRQREAIEKMQAPLDDTDFDGDFAVNRNKQM